MLSFKKKREFVEGLRTQWKTMWRERIDDKVRAEGISDKDYSQLFIERGTVIVATRKFKPLDFDEILRQYKDLIGCEVVTPNPSIGGWGKFVRSSFKKKFYSSTPEPVKKKNQQMKKCGRGWLHFKK